MKGTIIIALVALVFSAVDGAHVNYAERRRMAEDASMPESQVVGDMKGSKSSGSSSSSSSDPMCSLHGWLADCLDGLYYMLESHQLRGGKISDFAAPVVNGDDISEDIQIDSLSDVFKVFIPSETHKIITGTWLEQGVVSMKGFMGRAWTILRDLPNPFYPESGVPFYQELILLMPEEMQNATESFIRKFDPLMNPEGAGARAIIDNETTDVAILGMLTEFMDSFRLTLPADCLAD